MAKKGMIEREKKRQKLVTKFFKRRLEVKTSLNELIQTKASKSEQFTLAAKLQKFPKNSIPTRLHNRCSVTGRPKGFFRDFGLSRHVLREMAYQGFLPGVTKASW